MKKIMLAAVALTFLVAGIGAAWAGSVSQATVLFLKIAPGARPSGMGEAFVALADDATATWWNPAGLGFLQEKQLTMMYAKWLPQFHMSDLYYSYLAYIHNVEEWGTFGGSIIFLNLGETEYRDENNVSQGTFSSYEMAAAGSYGSQVTDNFSMGVSIKLIYSHLSDRGQGQERGSGSATAVAVDVGFLYKVGALRGLQLGATLSNMGPKVAYIDRAQADPLPTNLKLGVAYKIMETEYNRITLTADVNKELVTKNDDGTSDPFYLAMFTSWYNDPFEDELEEFIWNVGVEYWYSTLVGLRAGYWHDSLGEVFPLTFGVSLQYSVYRFDFSYLSAEEGHPLQDTMRYSLSINF
jgi:long-subunit fatty acid transport protein